jgi:hypothetical protein
MVDFSHRPTHATFVALIPQWDEPRRGYSVIAPLRRIWPGEKLEQLDAGFRQSIRARDNPNNGEGVIRRDFGFYFSSAKGI